MAASDSHFSRAVGFGKFLEVIDQRWQTDRLSDDEIALPPGHDIPTDDADDVGSETSENGKEEEKWADFGLDEQTMS
eukprot:CAMPEP_0172598496 /NCGR_PEP_ID=MMETSP1068-20121228/18536_1 /TAXON_ID=35684 /ORGANISM="Pseudopedinella elastica, Strain CCMP716" /LENGTH=76 /DNA_ID=CAMNT_0013398383 /DNA_START=54 /DNA_END=284 /DNA_ORIENTATION=+